MNATNNLLDNVRNACSLPSDSALAEKLGVTRALISGWRKDRYPLPDAKIAELCEMAKLDAPRWLAMIHAERAVDKAEKLMWNRMLTRLAAAAFLMGMHIMLSAGVLLARFLPRVSTVTKQGAMKCAST